MEANDGRGWARRSRAERRDAAVACLVRYFGPRARTRSSTSSATGWPRSSAAAATARTSPRGSGRPTARRSGPRSDRSTGPARSAHAVWNGYMEGAVRSGEQTADEVWPTQLGKERHETDTSAQVRARIEHDALGEMRGARDALWQAQTQRAVENFPISGRTVDPELIACDRRDQGGSGAGQRRARGDRRGRGRGDRHRSGSGPSRASTTTSSPSTCSRPARARPRT